MSHSRDHKVYRTDFSPVSVQLHPSLQEFFTQNKDKNEKRLFRVPRPPLRTRAPELKVNHDVPKAKPVQTAPGVEIIPIKDFKPPFIENVQEIKSTTALERLSQLRHISPQHLLKIIGGDWKKGLSGDSTEFQKILTTLFKAHIFSFEEITKTELTIDFVKNLKKQFSNDPDNDVGFRAEDLGFNIPKDCITQESYHDYLRFVCTQRFSIEKVYWGPCVGATNPHAPYPFQGFMIGGDSDIEKSFLIYKVASFQEFIEKTAPHYNIIQYQASQSYWVRENKEISRSCGGLAGLLEEVFKKLINDFNDNMRKLKQNEMLFNFKMTFDEEKITLIANFLYDVFHLHPWEFGNRRFCKTLMNYLLIQHGFPAIPFEFNFFVYNSREEYVYSIKKGMSNTLRSLCSEISDDSKASPLDPFLQKTVENFINELNSITNNLKPIPSPLPFLSIFRPIQMHVDTDNIVYQKSGSRFRSST